MSAPKGFIEVRGLEDGGAICINIDSIISFGPSKKDLNIIAILTIDDRTWGPFIEQYDEIKELIHQAVTPLLPSQRAALTRKSNG